MAFKFPKFNFAATSAKTRVFILLGVLVAVGVLVFLGVKYLGESAATIGPSKVAGAPSGLQSVPGGQLSPEYYRALVQANTQSAQQAKVTGGSAVPTLINVPGQAAFPQAGNCTVQCPNEENPDVLADLNTLSQQGKLSQDDLSRLQNLVKGNASVDEYAAALEELVKQGKLTPEQARQLLEKYKKQHANAMATQSAKSMDGLIKAGQLPVGVANDLLQLQKRGLTPAAYNAELARLVAEGKISPATASQLLGQFTQQQLGELNKQSDFSLNKMAKAGQITQDVANDLSGLLKKDVSMDDYAAAMQKLVANGKLTPATAAKLLDDYQKRKLGLASSASLNDLIAAGGPSAELARRLLALQANNAALADYIAELKRAVQANVISPEMAAKLLREYQARMAALTSPTSTTGATIDTNLPGAADFAKLQARLQQKEAPVSGSPDTQAFDKAASQAAAASEQARLQRLQALEATMSTQAQSLISAWQPPTMQHQAGTPPPTKSTETTTTTTTTAAGGGADQNTAPQGAPLIKAGTIYFAVLDTGVNSDYPDSPVMATVLEGKYKGAKLLGKLTVMQQTQDRVTLNFTLMNMDDWLTSKTVTAFAIDPDTARSVLANKVNYHYFLRYGSLFASSFLTGYATAITSSGSTTSTGVFGTTTTTAPINPASKIMVGLGNLGTAWGNATSTYFKTPPTVTVNAGVGIGILFMVDVT